MQYRFADHQRKSRSTICVLVGTRVVNRVQKHNVFDSAFFGQQYSRTFDRELLPVTSDPGRILQK